MSKYDCKDTMNYTYNVIYHGNTVMSYFGRPLSACSIVTLFVHTTFFFMSMQSHVAATVPCLTRILFFNKRAFHQLSLDVARALTPRVKQPVLCVSKTTTKQSFQPPTPKGKQTCCPDRNPLPSP